MSETNINAGFDFYLGFAKPLVLNLPEAKDRVLAAAWVQKLRSDKIGNDKLRTDYLKLLLFVLQKGRLLGPFVNNPNQYDTLDEFPATTKLHEIAKFWLEAEEAQKRKRILQGIGGGDLPPFTADCSGDLLEYVAAQNIPNFGVHAYYAISKEPLPRWDHVERGVFPKGALGAVQKVASATTTATAPSEIEQAARPRFRSRSRSRSRSKRSESDKGGHHEEFGEEDIEGIPKAHPKSPLGSRRPREERLPPTWGSNLISVGDPPVPDHLFHREEGHAISSFAIRREGSPPPSLMESTIEAPSLPYKTPPWDMSAPSLPYRTPPREHFPEGEASTFFMETPPEFFDDSQLGSTISTPSPRRFPLRPGVGISTPIYEAPTFMEEETEASSLPYRTPPWDMSAPSLPYKTPPWDMSAPSLPYRTPPREQLPEGEASTFFMETPPDFFDDSQLGSTISTPSPRRFPLRPGVGISTPIYEAPTFIEEEETEAPSLPYRTPPWDMSAPSLPYRTPPWDMSAPSLPYGTPELPAAKLPYTPPRKPIDPFAIAKSQYEDLLDSTPEFESDVSSSDFDSTFGKSEDFPSFPSLPPSPELRGTPQGLTSASPEAQDILDEVMGELSASQAALDLEELYAEIEKKYPGRRKDMPRTPPILSKYPKIREAGKRITYKPEDFETPTDVEWKSAPEYMEHAPTLSPRVDLREMHRQRPFNELFPTVERKEEHEKFFELEDEEGPVIFEDDLLVQSPRNKLQRRLQEVMGEISRAAGEVPAVGGIPVTTPRRSPCPVRSPEIDNDYPIFFEEMPEFESPSAKMSPKSRADEQYDMLMSPKVQSQPSPEKIRTPEFIRQMQLEEQTRRSTTDKFGLPLIQTFPSSKPSRPSPAKQPTSPPKPMRFLPKETAPAPEEDEPGKPLSVQEILARVEQQYKELYDSFVEESGPSKESPPLSPTKRTPTREEAIILGIPPVQKLPSPPPWSPELTPPEKPRPLPSKPKPIPFIPDRYEDTIEFQFPPEEMYEFYPDTPPSAPSPFAYESPEYSPREDMDFFSPPTEYRDVFERSYSDETQAFSPPMKDILAAHEFTAGFFDPTRPYMTKSIHVGTGTRKQLPRHSAPPDLQDVYESPEREFPSPEHFHYPTTDVRGLAQSPEVLPTLQDYGPLSQEEQYYISEFEDPKQQEMLRRVMRIVADVGEPLVSASDLRVQIQSELPSRPPYSPEQDLLETSYPEDFAYSPPAYTTPPRIRPQSPEETYEIPEFGFQQPYEEFVSPRISPRKIPSPRTPRRPIVPKPISPPPFTPRVPSPRTPTLLDTSPPLELDSPTDLPTTEELRATPWMTYLPNRQKMYVRQGITGTVPVVYHKPPFFVRDLPAAIIHDRYDIIHEVPETDFDEEHPEFLIKVKSALHLEPNISRRRMIRAARSRKPRLHTMSEIDEYPVEYPPSPISTRSPISTPPRLPEPPPIIYEGPTLVNVRTPRRVSPQQTSEREQKTPSPQKTRQVKRKVLARKLDFDITPPSPEPPKTVPLSPIDEDIFVPGLSRKIRELERRHADLPPLPQPPLPPDLMGFEGAMDSAFPPHTAMDYTPPRHLPGPLQPTFEIPGWKTPPHLDTRKKSPPPPFKFELRSSLRDILFQEEQPAEFGSPVGLDLSSYEPLGTEWGGFSSPEATPYEFEPSPTKEFGPQERLKAYRPPGRPISSRARGVDPFAMSAAEYEETYRQASPKVEPNEALLKAHAIAQEQYAQLFDSPSEAPKLPSPQKKVITTTTPTVRQASPRRPVVKTSRTRIRRTEAGPKTPPRKDIFKRREYDFLVLERVPEDLMPPGSPPSPISYRSAMEDMRQTLKTYKYEEPPSKRAFLYGHGVKRPKVLGQQRPGLKSVQEEAAEPPDTYEYWPGVYHPPPFTKPVPSQRPVTCPRAVSPVRPVSPQAPRDPFGLPERYELRMEDIGIPAGFQLPTDFSPVKAPKPAKRHKKKRTVQTTISETELQRIEQLVADIPAPDTAMAPFVPGEPIVYEEMPYSPPFKYIADRVGSPLAGEEIPEEIVGYASPRTPTRIPSPGWDVLNVEEYGPDISAMTPPGEYMYESSPMYSPEFRTPPPGPSEYPSYESPRSPLSPTESLQRRVREHEYTEHAGDERKTYMTKYMQIKSKRVPVSKMKAKRPKLPLIFEIDEPSPSPPRRTPPQVREETLVEISPYEVTEREMLEAVKDVQDKAADQYASLFSPEQMDEYIAQVEVFKEMPHDEYEMHIMDRPVRREEAEKLPSALTDRQLDFVSPPRPPLPQIPKRYIPHYGPPLYSRWDELEFTSPPKGFKTPPREFEEHFQDVSFEGTDIMGTSPIYMPGTPHSPPTPPTPPTRYPSPPSPIDSPTWPRLVQEHKLIPAPGIDHIRSGNRLVRLQRNARAPDLEVLEEVQDEAEFSRAAYTTPPRQPHYMPKRFSSPEYRSPPPASPHRQMSPPGAPSVRRVSALDDALITSERRPPSPRHDFGIRESPSAITKTQEIVYGPKRAGSPIIERTTGHIVTYGHPQRPPSRPVSPGPWGPFEFEYDIPEAFEGQSSPGILDVSDIPVESYREEEIEDYTWIV